MFKDNKKLVVETIFISEALKLDLSLKEFLVLLYFDNIYDEVFDMKIVAKTLNMKEEDVLTAYGSLVTKNLIKVNAEKDCFGKIREKVCLDNFYNEIKNTFNTDISKELFNNDYLMKILDEHKNREKDNYRRIWAVYSFLKWYEEYFVKR